MARAPAHCNPAGLGWEGSIDGDLGSTGAFDRFLAGLHGGGRLFSLLNQNPDLVALVVRTLGIAPRLADILARYPQAIDAVLDPAFFGALIVSIVSVILSAILGPRRSDPQG